MFMFTLVHSVSRLTPPSGQSLIAIIQCCQGIINNTTKMKVPNVWYSEAIHSISFKHTVSVADTLRCLHMNFENNQISLSGEMRYF